MNEEWAKQLRERLNLIPHNQENTSHQPQQSTANIISLRKNNMADVWRMFKRMAKTISEMPEGDQRHIIDTQITSWHQYIERSRYLVEQENMGVRDARSRAFDFAENNFHTQVRFRPRNQTVELYESTGNDTSATHDSAEHIVIDTEDGASLPREEDINNNVCHEEEHTNNHVLPNPPLPPTVQGVVDNWRSSRKRSHDQRNDERDTCM